MSVDVNFRAIIGYTAPASGGAAPVASMLSFPNATVAKTSNYTITTADGTIKVDASSGPRTITLPPAVSCYSSGSGQVFTIKKVDASANIVTVQDVTSGEMIDGFSTTSITQQYDSMTVQSNGMGWDVISSN